MQKVLLSRALRRFLRQKAQPPRPSQERAVSEQGAVPTSAQRWERASLQLASGATSTPATKLRAVKSKLMANAVGPHQQLSRAASKRAKPLELDQLQDPRLSFLCLGTTQLNEFLRDPACVLWERSDDCHSSFATAIVLCRSAYNHACQPDQGSTSDKQRTT
jgi:hypothetical protein